MISKLDEIPPKDMSDAFYWVTGKEPYQFQLDFMNALLDEDRVIIVKSRRIGISYTAAVHTFLLAIRGQKVLVVSPSLRQCLKFMDYIASFWSSLKSRIPSFQNFTQKETRTEITFKNGGEISSIPNNPDTARGYGADLIIIDEAAHFPNMKDIWTAVLPSISRGGKIALISTPLGAGGLFYEKFSNDNSYIKLCIPWDKCPDIKITEIRKDLDEDTFQQEYCCGFLSEAESYFPYELINPCTVDYDDNEEIPDTRPESELCIGVDIGRKRDYTAITGVRQLSIDPETKIGTYQTIFSVLLKRIPYEEQQSFLKQLITRYQSSLRQVIIDEGGIGNQMAEHFLTTYGSYITPLTLNRDNKNEMMVFLKKLLEEKKITIPKKSSFINSLHSIKRKPAAIGVVYDADRDDETGHADEAFSLALATYGFKRSGDSSILNIDISSIFGKGGGLW